MLSLLLLTPPRLTRYLIRDPTLAEDLGLTAVWFDEALIEAWRHHERPLTDLPAYCLPQLCCVNGEAIGTIGVKEPAGSSLLIGYGIDPRHRTCGRATLAVQLLVAWAWATLPAYDTLRAHVDLGNVASQRVLEKNGFAVVAESAEWNVRTYERRRN